MKRKLVKISMWFVSMFVCLLAFSFSAQAVGLIDVDFEDDPLFDVENFYPGKIVTKKMTVKNNDTAERDLYFRVRNLTNDDFASEIRFYINKEGEDKYYVGGVGDRFTLERIGNKFFFVKRMSADEEEDMEVKIKFKATAGNEFQNQETEFDIRVAFEDAPVEGAPPYRPGQIEGGNPGGGQVEGEETVNENPGETGGGVAGEETDCHGWPLWAWILSLAIYALVFLYSVFHDFSDHLKDRKVRWGSQLILTLGVFAYWNYFDKCVEFQWFVVSAVVGSVLVYSYYLFLLKKRQKIA